MAVKTLNTEQKAAVFHTNGPCVVAAVPGAGKTFVLTKRFNRLVRSGIDASRIMCTTFTTKAAKEMLTRLDLGWGAATVSVGTLHSIMWKLIQTHAARLFNVDNGEKLEILERGFQKNKLLIEIVRKKSGIQESDKSDTDIALGVDLAGILTDIGQMKNYDVGPDDYFEGMMLGPFKFEPKEINKEYGVDFIGLYREYEDLKAQRNQLDFDDMLVLSLRLLRENPDILSSIKGRWDHIMVDEFQDMNPVQWQIIMLLAEDHRNIFCVGDANQSLYGFRGANPEFIYRFTDYYPDAKKINMVRNYRCSEPVIIATNNLAKESVYKAGEIIGTGKVGAVQYRRYPYSAGAAGFVADYVKERMAIPGTQFRDFAILYRTNNQSRLFEEALFANDIPYVVKGGDPFYLTREVQDVVTYLKLAIDPDRQVINRMKDILQRPSRYLGGRFLDALAERLGHGMGLFKALNAPYPERRGWQPGAKMMALQLQQLGKLFNNPAEAVRYIRKDIDYEGYVKKNKDNPELSSAYLDEVEMIASKFMKIDEFVKVMDDRTRQARVRQKEQDSDAVTLSTVHSAKGLEYQYVIVGAFHQGSMPHSKATSIDEEMRVVYVAVTRAIEECTLLSHEKNNMENSEGRGFEESSFLRHFDFVQIDGGEDSGCRIMGLPSS